MRCLVCGHQMEHDGGGLHRSYYCVRHDCLVVNLDLRGETSYRFRNGETLVVNATHSQNQLTHGMRQNVAKMVGDYRQRLNIQGNPFEGIRVEKQPNRSRLLRMGV